MPRAGLTRARVVEMALDLSREGQAVTLAAVAARAGVRTPSLYKHVASAAELDSLVAEQALLCLADAVDAGIGDARGADAARATLHTYRSFAHAEPHLYALVPVQPGTDPRLKPHGDRIFTRIALALGYARPDDPATVHATRLLRSAAVGFLALEAAGGFGQPADVDASWDHLVAIISAASTTDQEHP